VVQPVLKEKIAAASSQQQAAASFGDAVNIDGMIEMSMKELIEAYAHDHGLLFKLKPGRMHKGHQIYRFGNVSIIIDSLNQKVYTQNDEKWSFETLERLLELHKRR
jgi:tuftelin-interacting protein 11